MLYHLLFSLHDFISVLNVTRYITFRTAAASVTAMVISLVVGPIDMGALPATVNGADMSESLLGMEFLNRLRGWRVENGVLTYHTKFVDGPDAKLTLTKETLDNIQLKQVTVDEAVASDALHIDGKKEAFNEFLGLLDTFPFWFNIVTP